MSDNSDGKASPARRWIRISSRTLHIATLSAVVGGTLFAASSEALRPWWIGLALSGLVLVATDLYSDKPYLHEVRGVAIMLKLVALGSMVVFDALEVWGLMALIALSAVVSHMPSKLRHRRLW
jgi:hypothetical protein